ncbi:Zn-dependent peptidase ImmA, M78 family [Rhodoferax sp. OV413]|uniref:XRE family transcriptional regulator n=1 Tax=Rhodoferax sp. OV413 TaxID=1855285 RepID=UPI00088C90B6|nr:XRE family transcriptional regulator [Rhodoferax sp. OV413]SDP85819.1 Zn-dependent peptidase ImmA, M78 family [Rhodoferax sp. OV413]
MFNPSRLTLARRRRKFSKKALAEALDLDQKTVSRYESGDCLPPPESIRKLAEVTEFPESFFSGADLDEPTAEAASFRSMSSMSARERDAALASGAFAFMLSDWVHERFSLPVSEIIDVKEGSSPEAAARLVREHWLLGEHPIPNVLQMLEAKGVRVFSLAKNSLSVDAFALWRNEIPYVFLNMHKTPERSRFDASHELGHLVLHRHGGTRGGRAVEDEANQFASAFLMPEADVRAHLSNVYSLDQLIEKKARWRVSAAALNYRVHRLRTLEAESDTFGQDTNGAIKSCRPSGIAHIRACPSGRQHRLSIE